MNYGLKDAVGGFANWLRLNVTMAARTDGRFLMRLEKGAVKGVRQVFKQQRDWLLAHLTDLDFGQNLLKRNLSKKEADDFLNDMPGQKKLATTIVAKMSTSLFKGGRRSVKNLRLGAFGISFKLTNKEAIKFLDGKLSHELSQAKGNISDTTKQGIARILRDSAEKGLSYQEIALRIREQYDEGGVFSQARAELIATREIGVAYEKGKSIPILEFQDKNPDREVEKFWQTVEDDRVTKKHRKNQSDGWIGIAESFSGTGDKVAPGSDNPRCRCAIKYKIKPPKKSK